MNNKIKKFSINDKVFIKPNDDDDIIGGIHNFDTDETLVHNFGCKISYSKCWNNKVKGIIRKIGINNFFLIEDTENIGKMYIFNNAYKEMHHIGEVYDVYLRLKSLTNCNDDYLMFLFNEAIERNISLLAVINEKIAGYVKTGNLKNKLGIKKMDYAKLVKFMGKNTQIKKAVEELIELAEALIKIETKGIYNIEDIIKEMAHVEMVLRSVKIVFKIRKKDILQEIKHKENLLMAKYPGVFEDDDKKN